MPDLTRAAVQALIPTGDMVVLPICGDGSLPYAADAAIGELFARRLVCRLEDGPRGLAETLRELHPVMGQGHTMLWADRCVVDFLGIPPGQVFEDHGLDSPDPSQGPTYDPANFAAMGTAGDWTDGTNTATATPGTDGPSGDLVLLLSGPGGDSVISRVGWSEVAP